MASNNNSNKAPCEEATRVIQRKHLLSKLVDSPRPILWLVGPPGSGKSTLLNIFTESTTGNVTHYRFDKDEYEFSQFLQKLHDALVAFYPKLIATAETNSEHSLNYDSQALITAIGNLTGTPWLLTLDDYQNLPQESEIHNFLLKISTAIEVSGGRLLLASRRMPPATWSGATLNRKIEICNELNFTAEEVAEVVSGYSCFDECDQHWLINLTNYTQGWPAGVIFLLEHLRLHQDLRQPLSESSRRSVGGYFSSVVFYHLSNERQTLLLKAAVLPFIPSDTAAHILQCEQGQQLFTSLCDDGLFTSSILRRAELATPAGSSYFIFQFHPMYHDFLREQIELHLPREEQLVVAQRCAESLAQHGELSAAVKLYAQFDCWPEVSALILDNALPLIEAGQISQLEQAFTCLPAQVLESNPNLLFWQGICGTSLGKPEARNQLSRAYEFYREQENTTGMAIAWRAVVDAIWLSWEGLDQLAGWIEEYDRHATVFRELPEPLCTSLVTSRFGVLSFWSPGHPELAELENTVAGHIHSPLPSQERALLFVKILYHFTYATGNRTEADFYLNAMRTLVQQATASPLETILLHNFEAAYHYCFDGSPDHCYEQVDAALELGRQTGILVWQSVSLTHALYMSLGQGDIKRAKNYLLEFKSVIGINNAMHVAFDELFSGWLAMLEGRPASAARHVEAGVMFLERSPVPLIKHLFLAGRAALMIQRQQWGQAWRELSQIRQYAQQARSHTFEIMTRLLQALCCLERKRPTAARAFLQRAAEIGNSQNIYVSPWLVPEQMSQLVGFALDSNIDRQYFSHWVALYSLKIPRNMVDRDLWPWHIRIRTLGALEVHVANNLLENRGRTHKRLREIVGILATAGPRGIPQDQLIHELWPDKSEAKGHSNLTSSLSRLRTYLTTHEPILSNDGRVGINPTICWVDSWEFLSRSEPNGDISTERLAVLEQAYRGEYAVPDTENGQELVLQRSLANRYLRIALELGSTLEDRRHYPQAADLYRRMLQKGGTEEEIYRRLMRCHAKLRLLDDVHAVYAECGKALGEKSGSTVSAKTTELYRELAGSPI